VASGRDPLNQEQTIAFISNTNYELAAPDCSQFKSKADALDYVESADYDPEEPLNVCFPLKNGKWDSAEVFYSEEWEWSIEDRGMGGVNGFGDTIENALMDYRAKYGLDDESTPVELVQDS
jgi:hypothetical protein